MPAISGATSSTHVLTAGNVGKLIHCRVTGTNSVGAASANSNTVGPIVAATSTTWDSAAKSANVALSNGDLTATLTSSARGGVRSIASAISPAKKYFELTVVATTPGSNVIGFANASVGLTSFPGVDLNGVGYDMDNAIYINNGTPSNVGFSLTAGDRLGVAINFATTQIWFRKNGGAWAPGSTPDPATNTGGQSFAAINAGPYNVFLSQITSANACIANFGPTFTDTVPSGYGAF